MSSDTANATHVDVTMDRRNPGIGHYSRQTCARCSATGGGLGGAFLGGLMRCPACREKYHARKAKK